MPPQLVNAVNLPLQNALNFPAAILQPPFFDPKAPTRPTTARSARSSATRSATASTTRAPSSTPRAACATGGPRKTLAHFKAASDKLVAQYSAYKPFADLALNGQLTLSENLADLAGLAASYDAYRVASAGKASLPRRPQFFTGFAATWRTKMREPRCAARS
jgi:putative endopeptidase